MACSEANGNSRGRNSYFRIIDNDGTVEYVLRSGRFCHLSRKAAASNDQKLPTLGFFQSRARAPRSLVTQRNAFQDARKKVMKIFKQFPKPLTGLVMIVLVAGLLACGQKQEAAPAAQAAPEPEKETIVWRLAQTWGTGFPIFGPRRWSWRH